VNSNGYLGATHNNATITTLAMKYGYIQQCKDLYPVKRLCDVLGVSRSGYYNWLNRKPSNRQTANEQLLTEIEAVFNEHKGRYGSPRMHLMGSAST